MSRTASQHSHRVQQRDTLGLRTESSQAIVAQLREGIAFQSMVKLHKASGLSIGRIAAFMRIPPRTLVRRKSAKAFTPDESERLLRLARLFEKAVQLFDGDVAGAVKWLDAPRAALGGASPMRFGETEVGAREVEQLIGRLEHGVFS